jgi:4-aminobutyrate aminotransferase-like enzyme
MNLVERRARTMGPNLPTFYERPVHLVRGDGVWMWDADGRRYLDCYNNVPHVGHCHPRVVEAICRQSATLNTHTRYLHDGVVSYIERLTETFGNGLSQAIMVCTGSEANDIALRMAQAVTGKTGIIATDNTYHGNTAAVSQLSTRRPPIGGRAGHVRLVPAPDSLDPVGGAVEAQAEAFAREVAAAIRDLEENGPGFAGFILCPVFANEGLPNLPPGFLDPSAAVVRRARGLILCDEVQPGFGRLGTHWWGHKALGLVPDIVTLGKPMGNGYPVAAVVTRPDVMADFREAFGYFNTFGGNPVAAAAAHAVLDVIAEEDLMARAARTAARTMELLRGLDHPAIAEVRGAGLFFGLVLREADGAPATALATRVAEEMKDRGVLIGRIGRHMNILKLRPPMPFGLEEAELAVGTLDTVLRDLGT